MTPQQHTLFIEIAGSRFWQAKPAHDADVGALLAARWIQPITQGKLTGYAVTLAGYVRYLGPHRQR